MSVIISAYTEELKARADKEDFFFIQIGVHRAGIVVPERGVWSPHCIDPLYQYIQEYNWSGILIEPQDGPFQDMKAFYQEQKERLTFIQCAVSDKSGMAPFYVSSLDELSSLSNDRGEPTRVVSSMIEVPCMTLTEIVVKNQVTHIDLLQIDTEGYDCIILLQYDFSIVRPRVISYEHCHCKEEEVRACEAILYREGYQLKGKGEYDSLFVLPE